MRQVKCKRCGNKNDKDKSYLHIHVTSGGNKQNRYYCNEDCYDEEQKDIFMLKQCQYFIDEVFGYIVTSNAKNKNIKELIDSGYTREEVYNCMTELKSTILDSLNYRQDIEDEYGKIQYAFAIIRGKIREITIKNKMVKAIKIIPEFEEIEYIPQNENFKSTNKRKSLSEKLGRKQ